MANKTKFTLPVRRKNNVLQICNLPERKKNIYMFIKNKIFN